jgi:hypothetical protein
MSVRPLLALLACAALAGCGALRGLEAPEAAPAVEAAPLPAPRSAGAPREPGEAGRLLVYFARLKKLPAAELGREHEIARRAFARARSDFNRVRLAMLVSIPNTGWTDEAHALELLEPVLKDGGGELQALALLLASHLQEQRRLAASLQGLQKKLDALKTLERDLIERRP